MTNGFVTTTRKPLLRVTLLDTGERRHTIPFVLDTGFTGQLLLPERYIRRLGIRMDRSSTGRLASGEMTEIATGTATVIWRGRRRSVRVLQLDSEPLLGMEFLWNHRITIDAVADGSVSITPLGGRI